MHTQHTAGEPEVQERDRRRRSAKKAVEDMLLPATRIMGPAELYFLGLRRHRSANTHRGKRGKR